ncbi:hypothetical protein IB276_17810 [Ensifer sp. ENS04]|uniref:hypothetical protein n=1 Tax=Ensifer sp. ENS04 TaxID=2769281 RepID=UPI00177BBC68|nr:hypothetical protein [Ensifer sp. ENS04]MBD9541314.1 hypothetical protein [Ensifer sp. ENS04]
MASTQSKASATKIGNAFDEERLRRQLAATAVAAELLLILQQDDLGRDLTQEALLVSADFARLVPKNKSNGRNAAVIPMPAGARVQHLINALLVEDGDASLAVKLMSSRFADAAAAGIELQMYEHPEIGQPAVALHLAVRSEISRDR